MVSTGDAGGFLSGKDLAVSDELLFSFCCIHKLTPRIVHTDSRFGWSDMSSSDSSPTRLWWGCGWRSACARRRQGCRLNRGTSGLGGKRCGAGVARQGTEPIRQLLEAGLAASTSATGCAVSTHGAPPTTVKAGIVKNHRHSG